MGEKKAFPLRIDPALYDALKRWADDELRSVNGQIEYLLAQALGKAGRAPRKAPPLPSRADGEGDEGPG